MAKPDPWFLPALMMAGLALGLALVVRATTGYEAFPNVSTTLWVAGLIVIVSAVIRLLGFIAQMWRSGIKDPARQLVQFAPAAMLHQMSIVVAVGLVSTFLFSMTFLKSMIPSLVPFWADAPLARVDALIGLDSNWLAVQLDSALPALGIYYGLWHAINLGGILWVIHWRRPAKGRFILSYMLTWGIGMALAYAFSSAGPLFTDRFDTAHLPASVRETAKLLWSNYQSGGAILGGGISAFPSLHVAIAAWFALALAQTGWPKFGIAYVFSIYFCSIALGWHYGADGAGGILVALAADWIARRHFQTGAITLTNGAIRAI